jgi:hypothetical protein
MGSRPDGRPVERLVPLRRMMPFLMPTRNEAFVLFEQHVPTAPLMPVLERLNATRAADRHVTLFHCVLRALGVAITEFPRLNRFILGHRVWERTGVWLSFSAKQRLDRDAPVFSAKIAYHADETLLAMVDRLLDEIGRGRRGDAPADREIRSLLPLPRPMLRAVLWAARRLDRMGLLPARILVEDPLYASVFVANLGSVGLDAAYHHLFEHGTIPIFVTMGRVHRRPVVHDDQSIGSEEVFTLRYTYDERIEDGFYAARALERLAEVLATPADLLGEPRP